MSENSIWDLHLPDDEHAGHGMQPGCIDAYEAGDIWACTCSSCGRQENICGHCLREGLITSCSGCA